MTREREFDQLLRDWMDDGADVAPEQFVLQAIDRAELTPQRGAWHVTLEGLIMRLQPAAPILGIAAVAIAAIALYAALATSNIGNPAPTPRTVTSEELPSLVLNDQNAPTGLGVDSTVTGAAALVVGLPPGGPVMDQTGFVDARETELSSAAGDPVAATWVALFDSAETARAAYAFVAARHAAPDGWGLAEMSGVGPLGDEWSAYRGAAYGYDQATVRLWRVNNAVLAVIGVNGADDSLLNEIAQGMDTRAH